MQAGHIYLTYNKCGRAGRHIIIIIKNNKRV
ncbi:hypothetical protein [Sulfolobus tengchongensis spindle-shaped virus 4]|nr:hypothetical protein [Sulfolobus tengchongensis spindle-shaped virus 4]